MEFRLTYAGPLLSSGDNKKDRSLHVHKIRREFHKQLQTLWNEHPILERGHPIGHAVPVPENLIGRTFEQNDFMWRPIVTEDNGLLCNLDILMLRKGPPGKVRTDIDNRLKTLFDALRMAHNSQELGASTAEGQQVPGPDENPFLVLLEDDHLITRVAVTSDMLLEPVKEASQTEAVRLVINVTVRPYKVTWENVDFAGS